MDEKLFNFFRETGIEFDTYQHPAVFTVEESKNIKSNIPGLSTKSLFLKDGQAQLYLICLRGSKRLNIKQIKEELGQKELHFGSPEELYEELKVRPGSVSLFALVHSKNIKLILDKELWESAQVGFHPNINTSTLVITHKNLETFLHALNITPQIIDLK